MIARPRVLSLLVRVSVALAPCPLLGAASARADSLFEGIDAWSREMVAPSNAVWRGPRVAHPEPSPRPEGLSRRDGALLPVSVHGGGARTLAIAEAVLEAYAAAGVFDVPGDGGQGGTSGHDLYVTGTAGAVDSGVDASPVVAPLDAVRAFALIDPRVANVPACVAQALADMLLRERDPAEVTALRRAGAAYFAWLATGDACAEDDALVDTDGWAVPPARGARYFRWLVALGARHDHNRGGFVHDLFELARQRTWEGDALRASPTLLEAAEAVLKSEEEPLTYALGELADAIGLAALEDGTLEPQRVTHVPAHVAPSPALAPHASDYALVSIADVGPGDRLTIWSRGEYGVRWALAAQRLDKDLRALGRHSAKVRDTPNAELHVELTPDTAFVLVSITNGSGRRVPTLGPKDAPLVHAVQLVLDRRTGF